ncbi:MAG: PDZ domain-containing protein, partial [Planctomycetes bacterium]|nr:PDZ domain-containing protein [Planctomycetota bacterium]
MLLFPAWPREWDVEFKLHAPYRTVVEGVYRAGKLERLAVTPQERAGDLLNLLPEFDPASGSAPRAAATFCVAPGGADPNDGSIEHPFATLERAREAVRRAKAGAEGPIRVLLRGGTHYLRKTFVLGPEDGGTAVAPIEYAAYPGEAPVLSGGMRLDLRWQPLRDGIFRAEVPAVREGTLSFDQLFLDGRRQHMARYPNDDPAKLPYGGTAADATSPERVKGWADPTGGFVHGLHAHAWGGFHYRIVGKDEKGNLRLDGGFQNNRRMGLHREHRFVENIFEELDAPGEWFLDRAKGILYVFPPEGIDLARATVEVAGLDGLIDMRGTRVEPVRFVSFRGLAFTHTGRTFMKTDEPLLRSDWCIHRGGAIRIEGAEDIAIARCSFDAVGGNAIFASRYNRRVEVTGCRIIGAGANGICFVGDPGAVRSPAMEYGESVPLEKMDRTPGPRTDDYPAQCRVHDALIRGFGVFEKQVAGVQIAMAEEIIVSHATIHDCPRAGINIGDGCWGGHIIEGCDVFDTVKETGDHGSFNSWGRDRYWLPDIRAVDRRVAGIADMPFWDARKTTIIRRNRWRCDHGWDIDLDDGSTNVHIYENLCLNGGIKLREGYGRVVENNIIAGNSFHPHVWYTDSGDVFRRNIVATGYRPIGMPAAWGKEIDFNLFRSEADLERSRGMGMDEHGAAGDPMFVDPRAGDYRVKDGSPALKLGFRNFPMDRFGVRKPELRKIARAPRLPGGPDDTRGAGTPAGMVVVHYWQQARLKDLEGEEYSAFGVSKDAGGVAVQSAPPASPAARDGFKARDLIRSVNGKPVRRIADLLRMQNEAAGRPLAVGVLRGQKPATLRVEKYAFFVTETADAPEGFKLVPLAATAEIAGVRQV